MTIIARDGSSVTAGTVERVVIFRHGPNAGRIREITIKPLSPNEHAMTFIRNRAQLGGGWINKTHVAKINPRSW
jgi:hypothetical protein